MRKPQSQPSLASLTEADREQLADWLRQDDYATVLSRVNSPRPDGFGLSLSTEKPLRTFYAKIALLDLVNIRLPNNKRFTLAQFESLAHRDIHLLTSADNEQPAGAHEQILRTVADLASAGDNTPTQLVALQRLADFPERAQLRANKERRAEEMHAHKIALDLRKEAHKKEMDEHRKQISERTTVVREAHLALSRQDSEHRRAANSKLNTKNSTLSEQSDELGPYAVDLEGIRERARKHFGITPEESARRAALRKAWMAQESRNSGDKTHAPAEPVSVRQTPSPEGTLDNSPAPSAPGNSTAFDSVPKGRLNSTETETALNESTESNP